MDQDEITEVHNAARSYLMNAISKLDADDYGQAIAFLDAAAVEIEALQEADRPTQDAPDKGNRTDKRE